MASPKRATPPAIARVLSAPRRSPSFGRLEEALEIESVVVVMCGLPARGKTFVAKKTRNYLRWVGISSKVFNVGNYRRKVVRADVPHDFFRPDNEEALALRRQCAELALSDMKDWLADDHGQVAFFDATNTTRKRRSWLLDQLRDVASVMFVEVVCDDEDIIERNIRAVKLDSPDYVGKSPEEAVADFLQRIEHYRAVYEPLEEEDLTWVKLIDVGRQIVMNQIHGYLQSRILQFLMNLHPVPRPLWFSAHAQPVRDAEGFMTGDAPLTEAGRAYAAELAAWMRDQTEEEAVAGSAGEVPTYRARTTSDFAIPFQVWTSTLRSPQLTVAPLGKMPRKWKALDSLFRGQHDTLTDAAIRREHAEEFEAWEADKLNYRFDRGESYCDLIQRLVPIVLELERQKEPVLTVAHPAVLRCLIGYFLGMSPEELADYEVNMHTVTELRPATYGCKEKHTKLVDGVPPPPPRCTLDEEVAAEEGAEGKLDE